jgi:hypothetical protein
MPRERPKRLSQMYENDQLGDCVIAGCGNVEGVITANAGDQVVYTDEQIITEYEGCEIVDVLQPDSFSFHVFHEGLIVPFY